MKKFVLILTSLFAIISCGGGGGSSGGSNTNNPTPTNPSKPPHNINIIDDNYKTYNNEIVGAKNSSIYNKPYVRKLSNIDGGENHKFGSDGNIEWHGNFLYDRHNPQNNSETSYTGYKIKVGIIDSGFNGNYYSNLRNEVKNIIRIDNQRDSKNEIHAYIVTSLIAGKNGIAKDANIYVIDGSDRYATREVRDSADLYEALYSKGVRIFNQSFGATEATYSNNPHNFYESRIEKGVRNFYRMAVDNGALFIFSAGNNEYKTSGILATLPYWIPDLEKGWINVNGLTSKNSNREGDFSWVNLKPAILLQIFLLQFFQPHNLYLCFLRLFQFVLLYLVALYQHLKF